MNNCSFDSFSTFLLSKSILPKPTPMIIMFESKIFITPTIDLPNRIVILLITPVPFGKVLDKYPSY